VATLREGQAFGELALINNKPRMATVTCLDNSHFMVLTKEAYEYVIGKMERRMLNDKLEFLSTLPAFSLMTKSTLSKVTFTMTKQTITKGNYLYREGDEADHVYILVNGEVEVTKFIENKRPGLRLIDEIYRDPLRTKKIHDS
jgi:CRP-like cAMP-binding protein